MVVSNILDPVHDTLDPTVWDAVTESHPVLKPQHKDWILSTITDVLKQHGYGDSNAWLEVYLTGSLTTFQYSDESDCDVSLFVSTDVFPEWSRAEMIGVMVSHFDGTTLPGTTHPMQGYVVAKGIRPADLYKPGLRSGYQIALNRWVVPPEHDRSHDVAREQNADYQWALEQADKMERLLRYEPDKAVTFWHQIHQRRMRDQKMGKGDYSQSNIIYKFLANRGLMPAIADISGEHIARESYQLERVPEELDSVWHPRTPRNRTSKTAAVPGWQPGEYGKFIITPQGEVHHWRTNVGLNFNDSADARPHHGEYIRHVLAPRYREYMEDGDNDQDEWTPGWIDPTGAASTLSWPRGKHERRVQQYVLPKVPGTRLDSREQNVVDRMTFAKTGRFMPHPDRIEEARRRLNLEHPVRFMPTYRDNVRGGYAGMSRDPATGRDSHLIFFNPDQNPGARNWAAWHELAHAMQYERDGHFEPTTDMPYKKYHYTPTELEAELVPREHADFDLWHNGRMASEKPRVLYNKFTPQNPHPQTDVRGSTTLPFIYDPEDDIVHLGPANSYHWELIQRTPELRIKYPMDRAYQEFSALSVPSHLHGRLEWPAKYTDFMGLTSENKHHRSAVNAALGATDKPDDQSWHDVFANNITEGQYAEVPAHTGRAPSEEAWTLR